MLPVHRCGVIYWSMATPPKKNHYTTSKEKSLSFLQQPSTMVTLQLRVGLDEISVIHTRILIGLMLCRQPQMLGVHKCNNPVMSRRQHSTVLLPILQLLHSFHLLFHNSPWALAGVRGVTIKMSHLSITYSLDLYQLGVSVLAAVHCKKKLLCSWTKLREAQVYGHEHDS